MGRALLAAILFAAGTAFAAGPEIGLTFARSTKAKETDILRLTYREPLSARGDWWMPTQLQLGASLWRVPDLGGVTQRFDLNATPIWRAERPWGYVEAGIGAYLLSKTINNDVNHLPSSFEFGSHLGAGVHFGEGGRGRAGIALQHLSNAGIKQPNGGINLVLATLSFEF
jgi:hypothetical protein